MTNSPKLFSRVALTEDLPQYGLHKGDFATVVEHYPMLNEEDGFSLEGFRGRLGLDPIEIAEITVEVSESQIRPIMSASKETKIHKLLVRLSATQRKTLATHINSLETASLSSDINSKTTTEALLIRMLYLPLAQLATIEAFLHEFQLNNEVVTEDEVVTIEVKA